MNSPSTPPSLPEYELLSQIARGSYGTVWLARNTMGVYRAVKIVHRDSFPDQRPFERELAGIRKFEPISRSHEGFVDVLHVGINEKEGYFYYVMELGDDQEFGQTIAPACYSPRTLGKEISLHQRLSFRECLDLGLALSLALAEMHKHGLVHRDVKPANIIFVNGVPKLADIGLVAEAKQDCSFVGTSGFIPPEGPGTPQADVYGLGKVLYEVSTGKDRQDFPELPTLLNQFPDRGSFLELNEVILRACKNDREKRYQTAWEMHADLLVLANGKSVRRLRSLERRLANVKRVAFVGLLALAGLGIIAYEIERQRHVVTESRLHQDALYGKLSMQSGDLLGALPYYADALQVAWGRDELNFRTRFGSTLAQCPKLVLLAEGDKAVDMGCFDPTGRNILIVQDWGEAEIYDLHTGSLFLHPFGPHESLVSGAYSHNGRVVVTTSESGLVSIWGTADLKEIRHRDLQEPVFNARFSPDDKLIVAACKDGYAWVIDVQTGDVVLKLPHGNPVRFADFSPDRKLIVTCGDDHLARLWNATTGTRIGKPLEHRGWIYDAGFSHDSKKLVTASGDHSARVWDLETCRLISPELVHGDAVTSAGFSPDDRLILTASLDGTAHFWRGDNFQPYAPNSVVRTGSRMTSSRFDPEGRLILCTSTDGSRRIWDLAGALLPTRSELIFSKVGQLSLRVTTNQIIVHAIRPTNFDIAIPLSTGSLRPKVAFNENGRFITAVSTPQTNSTLRLVRVFESATGKPVGGELSFSNLFESTVLSQDGKRLLIFGKHFVQALDAVTQKPFSPLMQYPDEVADAFFNSDGRKVVVLSGRMIHVWNASDGKDMFPPLRHEQQVKHAEFSPNESLLASCCADSSYNAGYAQIWNPSTGQPVGPQLNHRDGVLFVTWSPDGKRLGTAGEDFSGDVWDARTGTLQSAFLHKEKVITAAFNLDGNWALTASADRTARIWDADTGDPITPPLLHVNTLAGAAFVAHGEQVQALDRHGNRFIWNISTDTRKPGELKQLAHLLSPDNRAFIADSTTKSTVKMWNAFKTAYPSNFTTSRQEIASWHEFQAAESEKEKKWFAAAFHLQRLSAIEPSDYTVASRLARAEEHLKSGN